METKQKTKYCTLRDSVGVHHCTLVSETPRSVFRWKIIEEETTRAYNKAIEKMNNNEELTPLEALCDEGFCDFAQAWIIEKYKGISMFDGILCYTMYA